MAIAKIINTPDGQSVKLPEGFRIDATSVSIRRQCDTVVLEPLRPNEWPEAFFESIRIDDSAFVRPDQGMTPPAPSFE